MQSTNPFEVIFDRLDQIDSMLYRVLNKPTPDPLSEPVADILDIDQVSKITHLAKQTIYGLTHRKQIPHIKQGKKLLFSQKEIMDWISAGRVKTSDQRFQELEEFVANKKARP